MSGAGTPGPNLGYEILGAVKVKDGLFIGDELAAQDLEFVVSNKVTRIVNCCGRQVPNHWESIGVVYLTYHWVDADSQVILDQRDVVTNEIFRFIEEALAGAESVLIHSVRGQSRSCCVLSAYMMKKYSWGLRKTMEFLSFRRPDMALKPTFLQQLSACERRLQSQSKVPFSVDWNDVDFSRLECEDLLLRNTYINSQMGPLAEFNTSEAGLPKPRRLTWSDGELGDKLRLEKPPGNDLHNLREGQRNGQATLKCILKKGSAAVAANGRAGVSLANGTTSAHPASVLGEQHPQLHPPSSRDGFPPEVGPPISAWGPTAADGGLERDRHAQTQTPAQAACALRAATAAVAASAPMAPNSSGSIGAVGPYGVGGLMQGMTTASGSSMPMEQNGKPPVASAVGRRGPATNIRDSLTITPGGGPRRDPGTVSREGSADPGTRPLSRDPSPKAGPGPRRDSAPAMRGESPLRYPARRASSPASGTVGVTKSVGGTGSGSLGGFCVGGVRGVAPINAGEHASRSSGGMGAFRGAGPVKARADFMGGDGAGSVRRSSRPSTAPTSRGGPGSRPASPFGAAQRSGSNSRPASPSGRPSNASQGTTPRTSVGGYPSAGSAGPPLAPGGAQAPRASTLSAHMRRAPSPTPAFNRNPSPSKPRWRA